MRRKYRYGEMELRSISASNEDILSGLYPGFFVGIKYAIEGNRRDLLHFTSHMSVLNCCVLKCGYNW